MFNPSFPPDSSKTTSIFFEFIESLLYALLKAASKLPLIIDFKKLRRLLVFGFIASRQASSIDTLVKIELYGELILELVPYSFLLLLDYSYQALFRETLQYLIWLFF